MEIAPQKYYSNEKELIIKNPIELLATRIQRKGLILHGNNTV
jgi:hypothetical protein